MHKKNTGSPVWLALLSCISQLASLEKLYMNLTFLTPKGFLRKESSVRLNYETLLTELDEIEKKRVPQLSSSSSRITKSSRDAGLLHIITHIILFIQARLLMLAFYEKLVNFPTSKVLTYDDLITHITEIIQKNQDFFHHPVSTPIRTLLGYECDIVSHLLGSLKSMQEFQFLPSLLHLNDAHSKLSSWQTIVQSKESKKYSLGSSFFKSSPLPSLYQWLFEAKAAFVAKFSLYFNETLAEQTSATDMKNQLARQSSDYVSKIQNFQRKTDAYSLCIVLDAENLECYKGKGYRHPSSEIVHLSGLDSFPAIYAYPQKPEHYWPSIVMRVSDKNLDQTAMDKTMYFYDSKMGTTYFLCRVEPHITIVTIFESRKAERDNFIRDFLQELASDLRCSKIFTSLKPR